MPIFHLQTNVKNVPQNFMSKISKEIATLTHKPESKVMVIVNDGVKMCFGGSDAPAALIQFHSIGMQIHDHANVSEIFANLLKDIGVSYDRHYIQFNAPQPTHVGKLGTTVAELNKPKEDILHF